MAARTLTVGLGIAGFCCLLIGCSVGRNSPRPIEQSPLKGPSIDAPRERRESARPPDTDPSKKPPAGYRRMTMGGVAPLSSGTAYVLVDEGNRRGLLLGEGGVETSPLSLHLVRARAERPTAALLAATIARLHGVVVGVRVDRLEDDTVFGAVLLAQDGELRELEARPTDALSLGLDANVPVFVAESVLARAGVELDKFDFRRMRRTDTRREEVAL